MAKQQKTSSQSSADRTYKCELPYRFISLNDYVTMCRGSKYGANNYKQAIESQTIWFLRKLPKMKRISIHFHWVEKTRRRDPDNIAFAKKFILDAMVKANRIPDDGQDEIAEFRDTFERGKEDKVVLFIKEVD